MTEPADGLSCEEVERALQEALGAPALPVVARHLERCGACAREAEALTLLARRLRSLPITEPAQALWTTLPGRVLDKVRAARRRHSWAGAALAAAAVLLVIVVPSERERPSFPPAEKWLSAVAVMDSWVDLLDRIRSAEEAARVARRVAVAQDFGPRTVQRMIQVMEEEVARGPEALPWNLLDSLGPEELQRVLARLERGVQQ